MLCRMIEVRINKVSFCLLVVLTALMSPVLSVAADTWSVTAEEWARPRSADSLLEMQAVADAVKGLNADALSTLLIRYPGGEEGALWASELRDWLISLGVPSTRIEVYPGQTNKTTITLGLRNRKESTQ